MAGERPSDVERGEVSKSTGNSLTMKDSVENFGADVIRVVLVDAGDGAEDANIEEKNANANGLRIHAGTVV